MLGRLLGKEKQYLRYEAKKPEYKAFVRTGDQEKLRGRYVGKDSCWKRKNATIDGHAIIMCAGDLMCEPTMSEAVFFDGTYCFESCFKYVKPVFAESDFAIANLETMVCEHAPYAHEICKINGRYHCNAPVAYLDALKYAGFDALALANNHNADVGAQGLFETLSHVDGKGFMRTGMFTGPSEQRFLLADINNIRLAVFSYTQHINRNLDQELFTQEGCNVLLNRFSEDKVKQDIAAARNAGAEFLLCYIHFNGKEYSHEVTDGQRETAIWLAEAGMDCVMGSHTHALQAYEAIQTSDGRRVPVIYSLGNFITSDSASMITRTNVIYKLQLKREGQRILIERESYIPCRIIEHTLRSGFATFPTPGRWRQQRACKLLEEAQEQIAAVIGPSLTIDDDPLGEVPLSLDSGLPFSAVRQLTLRKICAILRMDVPNAFKSFENEAVDYITARYTWVRKGCIYFSRFMGDWEEKEARIAYERGARVIFSSKLLYTQDGAALPCIVVKHPEYSFFCVNRWLRHLYPAKVLAITGSVGKTTTKEMLYHVVSNSFVTVKSNSNANSHSAISDMLQKLNQGHEVYIQEVGAWEPGYVKGGGYMLNPDACLITNVGYPHVDLYGSIENILKDKVSLAENLTENGVAFLNYDDERLKNVKVEKHIISFAVHNTEADYVASDIQYGRGVIDFVINGKGESVPARIYMHGEHNVMNALAAFAVGRWLGIPAESIVQSLENYRSEGMRQNLCDIGGYHLYMDCYNSAPNSIVGSIHIISTIQPENAGKRIVVFGDIPRLGKLSEEIHQKVGNELIGEPIDLYLFYGPYSKQTAQVLEAAGYEVRHTLDREQLNAWLREYAQRDDIILFKAGHPMGLAKTADQVFGTSFHLTDGDILLESSHLVHEGPFVARWIDGIVEIQKSRKHLGTLEIPEKLDATPVGRIGKEACKGLKIERLVLPDTVYNIGEAAFYQCSHLKNIDFRNGLKVIEQSAFSGCTALEEIMLPEGIIEIGERAFYHCSMLKRVQIPASIGHIAEDAFEECDKLQIICPSGSYAEKYAKSYGIACELT